MERRGPALLVLLLLLAGEGAALRCWSCGSDTVPDCRDPFEPAELQGPSACAGPPPSDARVSRPACYKATVRLNEVETYVYRACDWVRAGVAPGAPGGGAADFCSHAVSVLPAHAQLLTCHTCLSDGCNAATPPQVAPPLLLLLLPPLLAAAARVVL